MRLRDNNSTLWIFLLGANVGVVEERFIFDVAYGISALEKAGILPSDIRILVDGGGHPSTKKILSKISSYDYPLFITSNLNGIITADSKYSALVIIANGHGTHECLVADQSIRPSTLISNIKKATHLRRAVLYLGQCFAGIFNYQSVGRTDEEKEAGIGCDIVIIGATNLSPSISTSTSETFGPEQIPWQANLFLLGLFVWFQNPVDVDGDGKFTIVDSYKFAGSYVNRIMLGKNETDFPGVLIKLVDLSSSHKKLHENNLSQYSALLDKTQIPTALQKTILEELAISTSITNLSNQVAIFLNRQEAWILNALPAQNIEF